MLLIPYVHGCARIVDAFRRSYANAQHRSQRRAALVSMTYYLIEIDRAYQRHARHK